jgi:Protein of unknown function (DUF4012)
MTKQNDLADIVKQATSRQSRRHRRKGFLRRIKAIYFLYLFIGLLVIALVMGILIANSLSQVSRAQDDLSLVFDSLEGKSATEYTLNDYHDIDVALESLNSALNTANNRARFLRPLGSFNRNLDLRFKLLDAAIHATSGSRHFLAGFEPTVTLLVRGGVVSGDNNIQSFQPTGERSVELLEAGQTRFLDAKRELDTANQILDSLQLEGVSADNVLEVEALKESIENIETYNSLALLAPEILVTALGIEETKTYLILSQNNDELRPSGGYIGTWGWMQVRQGEVQDFAYFPTTRESPTPPPDSLASTLDIPDWWIQYELPIYAAWDGSWSASFEETGRMAAWFYDKGNNV